MKTPFANVPANGLLAAVRRTTASHLKPTGFPRISARTRGPLGTAVKRKLRLMLNGSTYVGLVGVQFLLDCFGCLVNGRVVLDSLLIDPASVDDGRVIASTKIASDLGHILGRQLPGEIHGHGTGSGDGLSAGGPFQISGSDPEVRSHRGGHVRQGRRCPLSSATAAGSNQPVIDRFAGAVRVADEPLDGGGQRTGSNRKGLRNRGRLVGR